jgi:hypothetical protein
MIKNKKKFLIILILFASQSCRMPLREVPLATFIEDSNASPLQKQALWDGCMFANNTEINPTPVRDISDISIDGESLNDPIYKNAFSYGFYYCVLSKTLFSKSYTRSGWNLIGFKGDKIAYKSET